METFISHSISETGKIARKWLDNIGQSYANRDQAVIIGLSGHLGAGKTAFVKAIAKILDIEEEITSPTFVIMKIYAVDAYSWKRLIHIDAYRLERAEELDALRFDDIVGDRANLVMVEWPENISLEKFGENERLRFEMTDGTCSINRVLSKVE